MSSDNDNTRSDQPPADIADLIINIDKSAANATEVKRLTKEFDGIVSRTQASIFIERAIPRLIPPLCVGGLFLTASALGLWPLLVPAAKIAGLTAFAGAAVASPFLVKGESLIVTKKDALKRLDADLGEKSRPAQVLKDTIDDHNPPMARNLWNQHIKQMWAKWGGKFKTTKPKSDMNTRDPYRVRYAIALSTILAAAVAGDNLVNNVTEAFNWKAAPVPAAPVTPLKYKLWVSPPENINGNTHFLTDTDPKQGQEELVAHKNSELVIITYKEANVTVNGRAIAIDDIIKPKNDKKGKAAYQYKVQLTEETDTTIRIEDNDGQTAAWKFSVTPDAAPSATIESIVPDEKEGQSLKIEFDLKDDHGIQEGELIIKTPANDDPEAQPLPSLKIEPIYLPK